MAAEVQADTWAGEGTSQTGLTAKKEEMEEEDFTFDEPCLKKQKTAGTCQGKPTTAASSESHALRNELQMNWNLVQVLLDRSLLFHIQPSANLPFQIESCFFSKLIWLLINIFQKCIYKEYKIYNDVLDL